MDIGMATPDQASKLWDLVGPMLDKSVPYSGGRYSLVDMFNQIMSGEQFLWLVTESDNLVAAFTTRVVSYPRFRALSCQFCGGDNRMDEWIEQADEILHNFAKDGDCTILEMTGRPGWARKLPEPWAEEFRLYRRPVNDKPHASGSGPPSTG